MIQGQSMRLNISFRWFALLGLVFILNGKAYAVTSAEYASAGLQLYNQKNYPQAIQYYSAAISLDPNNAAALQGRANCYYGLGQLPQAIADYQKVYAIAPSPQLSQFIQALQAKAGTAAPAAAAVPGAAAPASADSYNQGVALYQQRQYAAAVPYLQKATQDNPSDSKAYYYLGATYMMMGDNKDAALNLGISNQKSPNTSVAAYVTQLKARLSPEDQQWVDGQLAASASAGSGRIAGVKPDKKFGIRFEPGISTLSMNDFLNNAQTNQSAAATLRANVDPTIDYVGHVPTLSPNIGFEPVYRLTPNLELGLPFSIIPAGIADDTATSANGVTVTDSFNISAFAIGLNLRYMFLKGDFQPFIAGGVLVAPMNIDYSSSYTSSGGGGFFPSGSATAKGNFTSMGFGGQIQLGVDWHLGDTFVITPFGGYQFVSASNFTSTVSSSSGSGSGTGQSVQLSVLPTADGRVITPTAGGNIVVPVVTSTGVLLPGSTATGAVPATVDLGGVNAGLQISLFF